MLERRIDRFCIRRTTARLHTRSSTCVSPLPTARARGAPADPSHSFSSVCVHSTFTSTVRSLRHGRKFSVSSLTTPPLALAVIPKPSDSDKEGLVIGWPAQQANMDELKKYWEEVKGKL